MGPFIDEKYSDVPLGGLLVKVVLITPPYDANKFRLGESLGLKYLAAVLRHQGIEVSVVEPVLLGWSVEETVEAIVNYGCDLLGISVQFGRSLPSAAAVAKMVKSEIKPHITMGGHFATFHYDELLQTIPYLDSIVRFEGEYTLLELVRRLNAPETWDDILGLAYRKGTTVYVTPPRPLIRDLDELPFPERDATSRLANDPHFGMIGSRGCLLRCSFCSVPFFYDEPQGSRWRVRSPANVVDEMELLVHEYGAKAISFFDDNFIGSNRYGKKRAEKIAREILSRRLDVRWSIECRVDDVDRDLFDILMAAGLSHVNLGIESGDQSVLNRFRKLTTLQDNEKAINTVRELGLSAYYHFIMFNPDTTFDELDASIDFIDRNRIGNFSVISNRLDVYKGTAEFYRLEQEGRLVKKGYEYQYNFLIPSVELVYQAVWQGLAPLYEVEIALQRAAFNLDIEDEDRPPRNHFLLPTLKRTKTVDFLVEKLSDKTVELARYVIRYFRQHKEVNDSEFSALVKDLYVESKMFADETLHELIIYALTTD